MEVASPSLDFSLDVVKYRDMPSRQWFASPRHTRWYYHTERERPSDPNARVLKSTLDKPLRSLALDLNAAGFRTMPSCCGHYHPPKFYEKTYDDLLRDADKIRGSGLKLTDVESGEGVKLQNELWALPWDRAEFVSIAGGTGGKPEGYLAFTAPSPAAPQMYSVLNTAMSLLPGTRCVTSKVLGGTKFEIRVYTGERHSQDDTWHTLGVLMHPHLTHVTR